MRTHALGRAAVRRNVLLVVLAGVVCALVLPRSAEALYRYFSRQDLARDLETEPDKWLDQDVTFTDELCFVWPAGASDTLDGAKHLKLDTLYFRCAVPEDKKGDYLDAIWEEAKKGVKDILERIEDVNEKYRKGELNEADATKQRHSLYWELHQRWKNKPIVTIFGKVRRADFYGPVQGKEEGQVRTEAITIVIDRIEKPRERWYHDLDD